MLGWALSGAFAAATVLAPEPSLAATEEELARARSTFFDAVRAQEEGRFRVALDHYAEVRRIIVSPQLLFNIATCHERINELLEARESYEAALALAREKKEAAVIDAAMARLGALEPEIPRVIVRLAPGTTGAEMILDDAKVDASTASSGIRLDPGLHRLVVRSDDHLESVAKAFQLARQEVREIEVHLGPRISDLPPSAAPPPSPGAGEPAPRRPAPLAARPTYVPAVVAGGVTLALAGAAVATGIAGQTKRDRFDELNAAPTAANRAERAALRSDGATLFTANAILTGAAVLAAGVTAWLFFAPPRTSVRRATAFPIELVF